MHILTCVALNGPVNFLSALNVHPWSKNHTWNNPFWVCKHIGVAGKVRTPPILYLVMGYNEGTQVWMGSTIVQSSLQQDFWGGHTQAIVQTPHLGSFIDVLCCTVGGSDQEFKTILSTLCSKWWCNHLTTHFTGQNYRGECTRPVATGLMNRIWEEQRAPHRIKKAGFLTSKGTEHHQIAAKRGWVVPMH